MSCVGAKVARKAPSQILAATAMEAVDVLYKRRGAMVSSSDLFRRWFEDDVD